MSGLIIDRRQHTNNCYEQPNFVIPYEKGTYHTYMQMLTMKAPSKAPDKQCICLLTKIKRREYAIKLICVHTKPQTKFAGMQGKKFQKRNIRICHQL